MAQKLTQHAIVGTGAGATTAVAVKECLLDVLDEHDVVGLIWKKPFPPVLEWVYDFVIDNSVPFVMFYDEESSIPPKVFREAEQGTVQKSRNPEQAALKAISGSGKVLFLWDDDENDDHGGTTQPMIDWVFDQIEPGTIVLELSNGLRPITATEEPKEEADETPKSRYEEDEPDPLDALAADLQPQPEVEDEPADQGQVAYTRDELLNMPAANVKRYGKVLGVAATTKTGIIDELFPLDVVITATAAEEPIVTTTGKVLTDADVEALADEAEPAPEFKDPAYIAFRRGLKCLGGPSDVKEAFEDLVRVLIARAPVSRERSLAITKLEEAHHWAVKAVILTGDLPEV
jgi:hypothetical protein